MMDMLEYWNLYLHRSFIFSELCRPALQSKHKAKSHSELLSSLREICIDNLANTVEAFLGLHNITKFAMQSWAAVHRALSCALLLGILGEPSKNIRVQALVTQLADLMSAVVLTINPSEMAAPLSRSVEALQKLVSTPRPSTSRSISSESFSGFPLYSASGGGPSEISRTGSMQSSPDASMFDEDRSPFSILNSIFWGTDPTMRPPS
jgi:hypothetical protein